MEWYNYKVVDGTITTPKLMIYGGYFVDVESAQNLVSDYCAIWGIDYYDENSQDLGDKPRWFNCKDVDLLLEAQESPVDTIQVIFEADSVLILHEYFIVDNCYVAFNNAWQRDGGTLSILWAFCMDSTLRNDPVTPRVRLELSLGEDVTSGNFKFGISVGSWTDLTLVNPYVYEPVRDVITWMEISSLPNARDWYKDAFLEVDFVGKNWGAASLELSAKSRYKDLVTIGTLPKTTGTIKAIAEGEDRPAPQETPVPEEGLSGGAVAGVGVGCAVVGCVIGVVIVMFVLPMCKKDSGNEHPEA